MPFQRNHFKGLMPKKRESWKHLLKFITEQEKEYIRLDTAKEWITDLTIDIQSEDQVLTKVGRVLHPKQAFTLNLPEGSVSNRIIRYEICQQFCNNFDPRLFCHNYWNYFLICCQNIWLSNSLSNSMYRLLIPACF